MAQFSGYSEARGPLDPDPGARRAVGRGSQVATHTVPHRHQRKWTGGPPRRCGTPPVTAPLRAHFKAPTPDREGRRPPARGDIHLGVGGKRVLAVANATHSPTRGGDAQYTAGNTVVHPSYNAIRAPNPPITTVGYRGVYTGANQKETTPGHTRIHTPVVGGTRPVA